MELASNYHSSLLSSFYLKPKVFHVSPLVKPLEVNTFINPIIKTPCKMENNEITFDFDWKFIGTPNDSFIIPQFERGKLNNYSFLHSILYSLDTLYYTSNTQQKIRDCIELQEALRSKLFSKSKISKENAEIIKNLENNIYTDNTIQFIVNFFDSFHLIVLEKGNKVRLYSNGSNKKDKVTYKSASGIVLVYFDTLKEIYSPLEYNLESRETFYLTWREPQFLQFLKNCYLYDKPVNSKKWSIAELREYIRFFCIDIDITLDKKNILDKFQNNF
jgi:hypothetical protein